VNARDLHSFLEVKSEFRHWIKNRISDFDFVENQDFTTAGKNLPGTAIEYHVTLNMAKELSMVERNEHPIPFAPWLFGSASPLLLPTLVSWGF
jgi:anti-repressor protein